MKKAEMRYNQQATWTIQSKAKQRSSGYIKSHVSTKTCCNIVQERTHGHSTVWVHWKQTTSDTKQKYDDCSIMSHDYKRPRIKRRWKAKMRYNQRARSTIQSKAKQRNSGYIKSRVSTKQSRIRSLKSQHMWHKSLNLWISQIKPNLFWIQTCFRTCFPHAGREHPAPDHGPKIWIAIQMQIQCNATLPSKASRHQWPKGSRQLQMHP